MFLVGLTVFGPVDILVGIRVSPEADVTGLDRFVPGVATSPIFVFQGQVAAPDLPDPVGTNGHRQI